MNKMLELFYKTSNTPLFILIGVGLVFIIITIVYLVYNQSKMKKTYQIKQNSFLDNNVSYNIFENSGKEVVEEEKKEDVLVVENDNEDFFDLKDVTKELESLPKERTIQLTDYEREQEETAIISYEELTQSIPKLEISKALREDVLEEDIVLDNNGDTGNNFEVQEEIVKVKQYNNYEHEECFLDELRNLKNSLN